MMGIKRALLGILLAISLAPLTGSWAKSFDVLELPAVKSDIAAQSLIYTIREYHGRFYATGMQGHILISEDGGENWRMIDSLPGVPDGFFVNDIKADLHDKDTVYVVVDDHKSGDFSPYVLKSTDRGNSWTSIAGDLPDDLSADEIAGCWTDAGLAVDGAADRAGFERAWFLLDDLYDDDLMVEARRPPKVVKA